MPYGPRHSNPARARIQTGALAQVQLDLVEERANALGRVAERLQEAIEDHRLLRDVGAATDEQLDAALDEVATAAWNLLVQRDCAGFRGDNRHWIRQNYDLPGGAFHRF